MIKIEGARVNNLKNIDVDIPTGSLTVITGLSGSGKSSLAFDTLFNEGQRRYIETFSAYARNFLGGMERPDVDKITGLSPVISIEQKTTNRNPRSTVGTVTEVYDYLRLLYARASEAVSYVSGERMVKYTDEEITQSVLERYEGKRIFLLAPVVQSRKGHYRELFESIRKKGFLYARVDGEIVDVTEGMKVDRYKNHNIEVVVDKLAVSGKDAGRLTKSLAVAMKMGEGQVMVIEKDTDELRHYSKRLMCPTTGICYRDPAPNNFSFNSPEGACPHCKGLGTVSAIDIDRLFPDRAKSINQGGLAPLGKPKNVPVCWKIEELLRRNGYTMDTPIADLTDEVITELVYGSPEIGGFDGIIKYISDLRTDDAPAAVLKWADSFDKTCVCPECHGARLNKEALYFLIDGMNISQVADMELAALYEWVNTVEEKMGKKQAAIAHEIIKEISTRLRFLLDVGLDYLSLSRSAVSLSGGESQRIRLATQIGSKLVNVLYILDEPSIGLHQRDNVRLINSLKSLRDGGNTVVVVEHDKDMMLAADWIVDIGPMAGRKGGEVVFQGTPAEMEKTDTLTAQYLFDRIPRTRSSQYSPNTPSTPSSQNTPSSPSRRTPKGTLTIRGARGNNLKNITVDIPLGVLTVVTGVSGSGKSTLINDTLQPFLAQHFYHSQREPLPLDGIDGIENIDKVVSVDQSPLGRTPRSNPATYTDVFTDIRKLFVETPEAKMRGYKPGRFSFNVAGGRCETCGGNGYKTIQMNFLPDVLVPCEQCRGRRYNRETLEVRFKGKSISEVLDMTINQAVEFFDNQPKILQKIKVMQDVGLGYIKLGQPSSTLSGGESQRVKLATELAKRDTGNTLYILDEPTTGLHFEDIKVLMTVIDRLVDKGNTVVIIEHNLDVIMQADHIIDMGPEGGKGGGEVVITGTPETVAASNKGITASFIKLN